MSNSRPSDNLIGQSNSFVEVLEQISQIAPLNKPVLIIGERGTGKELIAARCHYLSQTLATAVFYPQLCRFE